MLHLDSGAPIELGAVVARAGEGTVYRVVGRDDLVAKIFHDHLKDLAEKHAKVKAMVASPPVGVRQPDGFVVLTWPLHVLNGADGAVGYVMPRLDTSNVVEIHTLSNPSNRANPLPAAPQWTPHVTWHHLVNIAANLCLVVDTVHRVDAVIGDFQERNILVHDTTQVSLVDCDSMQFTDALGHQFLCAVGRAEFTAPELAGADLSRTAREKPSDLFALAVHVHLLLMGGNHPFLRGGWSGGGDQPDALTLARSGQWAGGPGSKLRTHALAPSVDFLPPEVQRLFIRAFTEGARDPQNRPSAAEWRNQLQRIQISTCSRRLHQIPVETLDCPWCAIDDVRHVRRTAAARTPIPQKTVPVAARVLAIPAAQTTPVPASATPAPWGRGILIGLGVAAVVGVATTLLALALTSGDSGEDTASSSGTSSNRRSGYPSQNHSCDTVPDVSSSSLVLTPAGLAVDVSLQVDCTSAVELSGSNVHVSVSDGAKDVAAAVFNLDAQPVVVNGRLTQRLIFPAGMYWRTPEMASSTVTVDITGWEQSEARNSTNSSQPVTAVRPSDPAHGSVDSVAGEVLTELSGSDYTAVRANMANRWVPQISSKKVGLFADGITYADADILRNHLDLRQRYEGVRLVWSGNWTTFNGSEWWVTMVDAPSNAAVTANGWCDAHSIDSWNCFAKYLSDTVGPDGTTVLRR